MKNVLTIAGSDSCGGAGIQADIKTMGALGVYGMSVITAVTAQNTMGVHGIRELEAEMVEQQISVIFEDIPVDAVKIGMVSNAEIIRAIKAKLLYYKARNIVVDPVMVSKNGCHLLQAEAVDALKELISIADIATPNIPEAEILVSMDIACEKDMQEAAGKIALTGVSNVLVKGGHRCNDANDVLLCSGVYSSIEGTRIDTPNTHGTGCTLSSAIASYLAKGMTVDAAVRHAKSYITKAIEDAFSIGRGVGPVGHFVELYRRGGMDFE